MGTYLNVDTSSFESLRNTEYIDKSMLISYFNSCLDTTNRLLCVSRPRRFGKTSSIKMLAAYYNRDIDSHALFNDLLIAKDKSYEMYINKYNTIFIDVSEFIVTAEQNENVVDNIQKKICAELAANFPNVTNTQKLFDVLKEIRDITGNKFIVLIDEWDAIFRERSSEIELQNQYIAMLRGLFKSSITDRVIAGAYLTGILPIKKYGTQSALNNFNEFTMLNPEPLSEFIGFTEEEVQNLCLKHNVNFSEMQRWYDGYVFGNTHIYNPKSVLSALQRKLFESYWTETETYLSLKKYIDMNFDGLKDSILIMVNGGRCEIKTRTFQNDMLNIKNRDDVLTLLVHLGYLAFDRVTKEVYIPNKEIFEEFKNALDSKAWIVVQKALEESELLLQATLAGNATKVAEIISREHLRSASVIRYNDENALASVLSIAYYSAKKDYYIFRELPTGKGFADLVFLPRNDLTLPALIVELKWDKSAQSAIKQIRDKQYTEALADYAGKVLLVGINYDKVTKEHKCVIEQWNRN